GRRLRRWCKRRGPTSDVRRTRQRGHLRRRLGAAWPGFERQHDRPWRPAPAQSDPAGPRPFVAAPGSPGTAGRGRTRRIRASGVRLRIRTELSDTETGTVIHSDQHEGSLNDLFELQGRIVVNVVRAIAPHINERELVRALRKHPQNMTAYDLVLQAIDQLYRM